MKNMLLIGALIMSIGFSQINISGDITEDQTWTSENVYLLTGQAFVKDGVTLTIEPGTDIYGAYGEYDSSNVAPALIVERGGMINAVGTASAPITFRSELLDTDANYGDGRGLWGGLIICGYAPISTTGGENFVEGIAGVPYGGSNADDNSGVLKFVRVINGGSVIGADNEINGITLAGVGRGTTVEYCEVVLNEDDGFEMFGGTVDLKYCSVIQVGDDAFDTDEGYQGRGQFLFVQKALDSDRAHEMDNKTNGDLDSQPRSHPQFANTTVIGAGADSDIMKLREGTGGDFRNYLLVGGGDDGIENDDNGSEVVTQDWSEAEAAGYPNYLYISPNVLMYDVVDPWKDFDEDGESWTGYYDDSDPGVSYTMGADGFVVSVDPRPSLDGAAYNNVDDVIIDDFFEQTNFKGAFGTSNWLAGWSWLDEEGILNTDPLSVTSERNPIIPTGISLHGNYPNPFNPKTEIQFELNADATSVQIQVFNIVGQVVNTISLGRVSAGVNSVSWSGTDQNGSIVPSGIYIYQITVGNNSAIGKMTLLK